MSINSEPQPPVGHRIEFVFHCNNWKYKFWTNYCAKELIMWRNDFISVNEQTTKQIVYMINLDSLS